MSTVAATKHDGSKATNAAIKPFGGLVCMTAAVVACCHTSPEQVSDVSGHSDSC